MKKQWMLIFLSVFILILAACGQGSDSPDPAQGADEVETEENNEVDEPEVPAEEEVDESNTEADSTTEAVEEPTVTPVELLFSDDQAMDMFRVERQIEATDEELFVATLEAWVAGPTEDGLVSLIPEDVEVQSVEEKDGVAHVSFSSELLDAQVGSGVEEMLLQQIAMTMKQFGFNETQILIDGEVHPQLFGHIDTSAPIVADSLEDYQKVE